MKLILISILSAILFFTYAHAEHDPLALLTIDQGQIRGTVMAEFTSPDGYKNLQQITVDCAVPDSIQANEVWTVTNRFISEKEMTSALQAIGQPENGTLVCNQTFSHFSGNWDAPASSDICRTDAGKQAVRIGLAYFDALGIDVDPVPRNSNDLTILKPTLSRQPSYIPMCIQTQPATSSELKNNGSGHIAMKPLIPTIPQYISL